jgi:hypothetical protein
MLKPYSMCVHTLTTDNGREFAQHERIASTLDGDFFFAHAYSSWERGANENMNGLIRQFFPKKMAFNCITAKDIELAMHRLTHRPRKCLGYRKGYPFSSTVRAGVMTESTRPDGCVQPPNATQCSVRPQGISARLCLLQMHLIPPVVELNG